MCNNVVLLYIIIYKNKFYGFFTEDENIKIDDGKGNLYIYQLKIHDGNCTLLDLDNNENQSDILEFYNENDYLDQMANELTQWDKKCIKIDDGTNVLHKKNLKESIIIFIISICIIIPGLIFFDVTYGIALYFGFFLAIISGLPAIIFAIKIDNNKTTLFSGVLLPGYIYDTKIKTQPVIIVTPYMVSSYTNYKYIIYYTFWIENQQIIHKLKTTSKYYDYLTNKYDLIVAYNFKTGKSVLVNLISNTFNN